MKAFQSNRVTQELPLSNSDSYFALEIRADHCLASGSPEVIELSSFTSLISCSTQIERNEGWLLEPQEGGVTVGIFSRDAPQSLCTATDSVKQLLSSSPRVTLVTETVNPLTR